MATRTGGATRPVAVYPPDSMRKALTVPALAVIASLLQPVAPVVKSITTLKGIDLWYAAPIRNRIYFTDGDSVLWMLDRSTGRRTQVWRGQLQEPVVSRTADRIAFARSSENQGEFIWTMPLDPATGMASGPAQSSESVPGLYKVLLARRSPARIRDPSVVPQLYGAELLQRTLGRCAARRP